MANLRETKRSIDNIAGLFDLGEFRSAVIAVAAYFPREDETTVRPLFQRV